MQREGHATAKLSCERERTLRNSSSFNGQDTEEEAGRIKNTLGQTGAVICTRWVSPQLRNIKVSLVYIATSIDDMIPLTLTLTLGGRL